MNIPERIKQARTEAGLTQQKLAELCHVTTRTVQRWETGDRLVATESLRIVAKTLKLPLEDLIP